MNTSRPRTFSINSTLTSPSLNRPTSARPNCTCRCRVISCASTGFALPVNTAIDNESNSLLCDMGLSSKWLGWKDYSALRASPLRGRPSGVILPLLTHPLGPFPVDEPLQPYNLAGVEGFEPPYGGIKTRCLTAWRHPNGIN